MRSLLEDTPLRSPVIQSGVRYGTSQLNIATGPFTIPAAKDVPAIMAFVLTGAAQINLPPITGAVIPMEGRSIRIANQSGAANTATVKSDTADGAATIGTVAQNVITEFVVVNGVWMVK